MHQVSESKDNDDFLKVSLQVGAYVYASWLFYRVASFPSLPMLFSWDVNRDINTLPLP